MRRFAALCDALDAAADPAETIAALRAYCSGTPAEDVAWALFLLSGNRLSRALPAAQLECWATEAAQIPSWLVQECLQAVGDPGEALALLLPASMPDPQARPESPTTTQHQLALSHSPELSTPPLSWNPDSVTLSALLTRNRPAVAAAAPAVRKGMLWQAWQGFSPKQRLLWHRILEGTPPQRVAHSHLIQALAESGHLPPAVVEDRWDRGFTQREPVSKKRNQPKSAPASPAQEAKPTAKTSSPWQPTAALVQFILAPVADDPQLSIPYPFGFAIPLDGPLASLGQPARWHCEWLLPGTRAQLIRRRGRTALWSADLTILSESFPTVIAAAESLPEGTVLDGVLIPNSPPNPPHAFVVQDLLEHGGRDLRLHQFTQRRALLTRLFEPAFAPPSSTPTHPLHLEPSQPDLFHVAQPIPNPAPTPSPVSPIRLARSLPFLNWDQVQALHESARAANADGLLLKGTESSYADPSQCLEWRIAPLRLFAVLVAVQPDPASRSQRLSEYTLALRHCDTWSPVAKLPADLTEEDLAAIDAFARDHVTARFGPVRTIEPLLVFELAFDGLQPAPRTRQGFALRSPRLLRWCRDLTPDHASTLGDCGLRIAN